MNPQKARMSRPKSNGTASRGIALLASTCRRLAALALSLALAGAPLLVGGCWDLRELEDFAHVRALALDTGAGPGSIKATALIRPPPTESGGGGTVGGGGGGGGGGGSESYVTETAEGPDLLTALHRINQTSSRLLTYTHLSLIIIGEDLARRDITPIVDGIARSQDFRRSIPVAVADTVSGEEILKTARSTLDPGPAAYLSDLLTAQEREFGMSFNVLLNDLLVAYGQPGEDIALTLLSPAAKPAVVKPPGAGGGGSGGSGGGSGGGGQDGQAGGAAQPGPDAEQQAPTEKRATTTGLALFSGNKMVGKLTRDQVPGFLLTRGVRVQVLVSVEGASTAYTGMTFAVTLTKYKVTVKRVGERVDIDVKIGCRATLEDASQPAMVVDEANLPQIRKLLASDLERRANEAISAVRAQGVGDVFQFSLAARQTFQTWPQWSNYDWTQAFLKASITFKAEVMGVTTHTIYQPLSPNR